MAHSYDKRVEVVVVTYRTAELVKECLRTLHSERQLCAQHEIEVRCTLVDNASGDTAILSPFLEETDWQGWVELISSDRNGGFAYGNNLAFQSCYRAGRSPDYFFLLNPDTEVRPGAILELVRFLEAHPSAATAGSCMENADGSTWPYAFRFPNIVAEAVHPLGVAVLERLLERYVVTRKMGEGPTEVDWFPGAAMMCRANVVQELGGMDESYFLYYEETDFCLKLKRAGWSNWYVPQSRVMHLSGQSTGVTGENDRKLRPSYWYDSRRRYFQKNHGALYAVSADALALAAIAVGGLQRKLRGKEQPSVTRHLRDFYRGSALRTPNRRIESAVEFRAKAR
jgi:N-acetylglucosaminyl-diphospho-decaprenol L-rhamnosyltransferase